MSSGTTIQLDGLEVHIQADGMGKAVPWGHRTFKYRVRIAAEDGYVFECSAWGEDQLGERNLDWAGWLVLRDLFLFRRPTSRDEPYVEFRRRSYWRHPMWVREEKARLKELAEAWKRLAPVLERNEAKIDEADELYQLP